MKPQDIVFFVILVALLLKRSPIWFAVFGSFACIAAIPLFYLHIFFTAEHLTWYSAVFFGISAILSLHQAENRKK